MLERDQGMPFFDQRLNAKNLQTNYLFRFAASRRMDHPLPTYRKDQNATFPFETILQFFFFFSSSSSSSSSSGLKREAGFG
jgi:hypothetical protein